MYSYRYRIQTSLKSYNICNSINIFKISLLKDSCHLPKKISIIAGPSCIDLATKVGHNLDMDIIRVESHTFTDGESKIRMDRVEEKYCIVIQSTYPPADRHLLQALMILKKCSDDKAEDLCIVIPYLAYTRQDRAFLKDEFVSISLVAKLLEAVGTKRLITVDAHSIRALSYFTIDVQNISSIPLLAEYAVNKMKLNKPIVVSPDSGGMERARQFANILETDTIALKKSRDRNTGEVYIDEKLNYNILGRDVIILDDMISSGGSIVKACELLKRNQAGKVYAMCTHALLIGDAKKKIEEAGVEEIIATNSIPSELSKVDLSIPISAKIRSLIELK